MSPHFYLTDQEHRQALALVRRMELRPGGMVWSPLLDALETDRPRVKPEPVASAYPRLAKADRVHRLHSEGLDEAMRRVGGENRGY